MRETWKPIPSLPGLEASSLGRLRVTPWKHLNGRTYGGFARVGQWGGSRYLYRFKGKTYRAAPLICEAFHGPRPVDRQNCLHKDENSRNNRPGNLKWGTQVENLNMPKFLAYCRGRTGVNSPTFKGQQMKEQR